MSQKSTDIEFKEQIVDLLDISFKKAIVCTIVEYIDHGVQGYEGSPLSSAIFPFLAGTITWLL